MSTFVLDCSMAMAWCFEDQVGADSDAVLDGLQTGEAIVPALWSLEVSNVFLTAERQGLLTPADSMRAWELLASLPISVDNEEAWQVAAAALSIGRQYALSSYDAAYLELAMRLGTPLATRDKRLRPAALKAGVALLSASAT